MANWQSSYKGVVLARAIEVVARFAFMFGLIRILDVTGYGRVSFEIAVMQLAAAIFYTAFLQILSFEPAGKKPGVFQFVVVVHGIFSLAAFVFVGSSAVIFIFYGVLYLLTAWYTAEAKQVRFALFRALAFVSLSITTLSLGSVPLGFLAGLCFLLLVYPFHSLKSAIVLPTSSTFKTMQLHNICFQGIKLSERIIAEGVLNSRIFGLYSVCRDFLGAINLTVFSSLYQVMFKRYSNKNPIHFMRALNQPLVYMVMVLVLALALYFDQEATRAASHLLSADFPSLFFASVVALSLVELGKALSLMIVESRNDRTILLRADAADLTGVFIMGVAASLFPQRWLIFAVIFGLRFVIPILFNFRAIYRKQ